MFTTFDMDKKEYMRFLSSVIADIKDPQEPMPRAIAAHTHVPEFQQVLKLSPDAPVTNEFRADMDQWLLEQFGRRRCGYVVQGILYVHPNTMEYVKQQIGERNEKAKQR